MKKLIVIIGPTASKKTTLAHQLALNINGEIINGDVFQMYRDINAGVNKPNEQQLQEVNYHLLNQLNVLENYSIFNYQKDFELTYRTIDKKNKPVILCGGSHLYLDAIIKGYDLSNSEIQKYYEIVDKWSDDQLIKYLQKYDPISLQKTLNNFHRMKRAVAYLKANNNQPKHKLEQQNNKPKYNTLVIMTNKAREELYNDINHRFDSFFKNNAWIHEVKELINQYGENIINSQAFKAIGYREIAQHLINKCSLDLEKIKTKTRHLAKHQLTWCNNKFNNKIMFNYENDNFEALLTKVKKFLYD